MTIVEHDGARARAELLRRAFAAYNAREADLLVAMLHEHVDWPDGTGGRLHGREAVRAYWTEQWTRTQTHDQPVDLQELPDGRVAVRLSQIVRARSGSVISEGDRLYLFQIVDDLIRRLDLDQP